LTLGFDFKVFLDAVVFFPLDFAFFAFAFLFFFFSSASNFLPIS